MKSYPPVIPIDPLPDLFPPVHNFVVSTLQCVFLSCDNYHDHKLAHHKHVVPLEVDINLKSRYIPLTTALDPLKAFQLDGSCESHVETTFFSYHNDVILP